MNHLSYSTQINNASNVHVMNPNALVVREREFLFQMGDQLAGVYRVNSGSVKIFRTTEDGEQQIIGFYMPGDFIGLDALADGVTRSAAVIMETSNLSFIPFETIMSKGDNFDYPAFIQQLGISYNRDKDYSMMLSQCTERRLAWFLMNFSDAKAKHGCRADEFVLPMPRADIALFLGMAVETLSRVLARMRKQGLISTCLRNIELLDMDSLWNIANGGLIRGKAISK